MWTCGRASEDKGRDRKKNVIEQLVEERGYFWFVLFSHFLFDSFLSRFFFVQAGGGCILLILLLSPSLSLSSSGVFAFFHHQICPRPLPPSLPSSLPSFLLVTGTPALEDKYKLSFLCVFELAGGW
jgi:hypothetical protein